MDLEPIVDMVGIGALAGVGFKTLDIIEKSTRTRSSKKYDPLGKVMAKVAKGQKLNKRDRLILSAGVDGAKKARSEMRGRKRRRRKKRSRSRR